MVKVTLVDRRGPALGASKLRCLAHLPTINMTAGCAHGCAYCYIRGYSQYPGDDAVLMYRDTAERVERELVRRRQHPAAVYFCPSSDAFMPVREVLEQSYRTMRLLLERGVGVQFVTKGAIPDEFFELFAGRPELVAGQIGLTSLDDRFNSVLEPRAAPASRRVEDLGRLISIGVAASLRADPVIHGVTDDDAGLDGLVAEAANCGVRDVSASYLFLRPAITASLKRYIRDKDLLRRILAPFSGAGRSAIAGSDGGGVLLPADIRRAGFERVRRVAERHGLALHICGCKNSDLTNGKCQLTNVARTARRTATVAEQPQLW